MDNENKPDPEGNYTIIGEDSCPTCEWSGSCLDCPTPSPAMIGQEKALEDEDLL